MAQRIKIDATVRFMNSTGVVFEVKEHLARVRWSCGDYSWVLKIALEVV